MTPVAVAIEVVHVETSVTVAGVLHHQDCVDLASQTAVHVGVGACPTGGVAREALEVGVVVALVAIADAVEQRGVGLASQTACGA